MSVDWAGVRAQFPALAYWTYLNSATFGQLPRAATEAVARRFAHRDELACSDFLAWFDDMDRIRGKCARMIHASPDDIAFVPTASHALANLIHGMQWQAGDRVVTLGGEFPNYLYMPAYGASRSIEFVEAQWERFFESIDGRTRLVAISEVNYSSGFRPPLAGISSFLRERGVVFFVDGTQSLGALEFDIRNTPVDCYAVHGYKWLLSPTGAGFAYVSPELRARVPATVIGWRSHKDWRNVDHLHHGTPEFVPTAEKYEGGMVTFEVLYAMEQSLDLMLGIGAGVIENRVLELASLTRRVLRDLGGGSPDTGSQIVCARFEGQDPSALSRALKDRRILTSARKGHLRVSPHFYNNEEDIAKLGWALREILGR
ncbi:MAG: aminotransferase class V-fold PLP-dependent enzyme [Bryobacteraceae bacterium]|nr:aminotransferase class V-fold PLP-dependent enzyme [Bryobacteraceae bacterium]